MIEYDRTGFTDTRADRGSAMNMTTNKPSGVDWTWLNTTGNSLGTLAQNTSAFLPFTTSHFHFACKTLVFWTVLHRKFRWLTGTISLLAQGDWTSRGSDPDPSKLFFMVDMSFWLTVTKLLASRKKHSKTPTTLLRDIPTASKEENTTIRAAVA